LERQTERTAEALALAQKAVQLAPKRGSCLTTLALALYRTGDWKDALATTRRSMALQGENSHDLFIQAMTQQHLGDEKEAVKAHDEALRRMKGQTPDFALVVLRSEAAALLGSSPRPKK
jgi:tetratricopeptide (TPR) repeat protein